MAYLQRTFPRCDIRAFSREGPPAKYFPQSYPCSHAHPAPSMTWGCLLPYRAREIQIMRPCNSASSARSPDSEYATARSAAAASGPPRESPTIFEMITTVLTSEDTFIEMTLKGRAVTDMPWRLLSIRPVLLKSKRQLQFSFFSERQNVVKNYDLTSALMELKKLISLSWSSIQLRSLNQDINIQISRKGKIIVHRSSATGSSAASSPLISMQGAGQREAGANTKQPRWLQHDRSKQLPISPTVPHPFLQKLGMQTPEGRIKSDMQDKFTQVNEFLKLLGHTGVLDRLSKEHTAATEPSNGMQDSLRGRSSGVGNEGGDGAAAQMSADRAESPASRSSRVCILDCGCGSSHLTFGTFHYLNHVLGLPARIMGVDTNAALMRRSNEYCRQLDMDVEEAEFFESPILQFTPPTPPDVVLALHACDTATDEALAVGIKQGAPVILAVPCCHKNLHRQMAGRTPPVPFGPLMRHGIMKQRQIDMLTDTFRAQLLRIMGYKTDAVEFISAEHTPRNLLLRAVKQPGVSAVPPSDGAARQLLEEYDALKAFWGGISPYLETLIAPELEARRAQLD